MIDKIIEQLELREHTESDVGIRSKDGVGDYINDDRTVALTTDPDRVYAIDRDQWDTEVESLAERDGYMEFRAEGKQHRIDLDYIPDCIDPLDALMDASKEDFPVAWELDDGWFLMIAPYVGDIE